MVHTHPVIDKDNHFIIDPISRSITKTDNKKRALMQYDHNSERLTFEIERFVEGHDLMLCNKVEVHYSNADSQARKTNFKAEAAVDGSDFELEYAPDEDNTSWVVESINRLIKACNTSTPDLDTIGKYVDIQSAIDYYIFTCFVEGVDATDKNYILATFDGSKWFFSAYDLDTTFGNHWNGKSYYKHNQLSFADYARTHKMMEIIHDNMYSELVARYKELRADILSEANVLHLFSNFVCGIPSAAYEQESNIWPEIPGTKSNDINQIMELIRLRLEWLDKEMGVNQFSGEMMAIGDFVVKGTDGVKRQIVFNDDGSCSWTVVK